MSLSAQPRLTCTVAALGAGLLLLGLTPQIAPLERLDHTLSARLTATEPAAELHGSGTFEHPRYRVKLEPPPAEEENAPLQMLIVDDDPDGIFEAKPPSPADQAVILANLLKRGARHLAVTFPFGWEDADPISLTALRVQLDRFDSATLGFPLAYGSGSDPVASPFLRMSLPEEKAQGSVARLPVVNRIATPAAETGGDKALAGFTRLLNEEETAGSTPLLARWNQRIVFALPLAAEIARRGIDPASLRIEPGKTIVLGENGPWIPIDETGRLKPAATGAPTVEVPASALIGGEVPEDFATGGESVFLRDRRTLVPEIEIRWADQLPAILQEIRLSPLPSAPQIFSRPDALLELAAMAALASLCGLLAGSCRRFLAPIVVIALAVAVWFALQTLVRDNALLPLPFAFLAAPLGAGLTRLFLPGKKTAVPASPATAVETPPPVTEPPAPPARKAAKKAAAPAKKAAKKSPKKKKR